MTPLQTLAYRAALIVPVSSPPVPNGTVEVADGRIVAVHSRPLSGAVDLGRVALLPGPINTHTHLEFGDLEQPLSPPAPFTAWLKSVIADRRSRTADRSQVLAHALRECEDAGTAAVGEIATRGWSSAGFDHTGPTVVAFHESIGLRPERLPTELAAAREFLESGTTSHRLETCATGPRLIRGLSPHAPYSVHPDLVRQLVSLAVEHSAPVAMHLAETPAELQLLRDGTGEFVEFLSGLGAWDPQAIPRGRRVRDSLRDLAPAPRVLVVHGNYLDEDEIEFLVAHPHFSVVYCPRTHAYFSHAPHPWRRLLDRGVRVVLGTDSRASNPDLSVWREACFLAEMFPDVPAEVLLRMITLDAAWSLGLEARLGSLEPGKEARLAVVPLPGDEAGLRDIYQDRNLVPFRPSL